jgi:hypothetical protein
MQYFVILTGTRRLSHLLETEERYVIVIFITVVSFVSFMSLKFFGHKEENF